MGMIEELQHHGYKLSPGTLYPILHHLQSGGKRVPKKMIDRVISSLFENTGVSGFEE